MLEVAKKLGADQVINAREEDPVQTLNDLTHGEGVDVAVEAVGGKGESLSQSLGMACHNGILTLYGDNYAPVKEFCFHRFHEDGLESFGWNRVVWGGDWPVCNTQSNLKTWAQVSREIVSNADEADQRKLFHENAERIYLKKSL